MKCAVAGSCVAFILALSGCTNKTSVEAERSHEDRGIGTREITARATEPAAGDSEPRAAGSAPDSRAHGPDLPPPRQSGNDSVPEVHTGIGSTTEHAGKDVSPSRIGRNTETKRITVRREAIGAGDMFLLSLGDGRVEPMTVVNDEQMSLQFRRFDLFFELGTELAGLGWRDPLGQKEERQVSVAAVEDQEFSELDGLPRGIRWKEEIDQRSLSQGSLFVVKTRDEVFYVVKVIEFSKERMIIDIKKIRGPEGDAGN
ncbi:MAG: hypothetical protein ACYS9X_13095 [Planctomycetota bacterium]|jgi:hypothetical protein